MRVLTDIKRNVLYLTRGNVPHEFKKRNKYIQKHLSIISFKPEALINFAKSKQTELEKTEDIELLRALEIGLKIKSILLKGDSFSVDMFEDYQKAKVQMKTDRFYKLYK